MIKKIAIEIISSLLVLLFVYTGLSKLLDFQTFHLQLSKSPFITKFADAVAWTLPIGELVVALALVFKWTRLPGLYASLFLMTMFTAYIYAMLNYSYDLPCSCGGIISKMTWTQHLWFNAGYTALCVGGILLESSKKNNKLPEAKLEELPPVVYAAMS
jgi:uncharacterized membrane protein YphA (DoxX/SURF4 family)